MEWMVYPSSQRYRKWLTLHCTMYIICGMQCKLDAEHCVMMFVYDDNIFQGINIICTANAVGWNHYMIRKGKLFNEGYGARI